MSKKSGAGRPVTIDVKNNHKQYFREYYHKSNADHYCICGQYVKLNSLRKHLLTKKHEYLVNKKINDAIVLTKGPKGSGVALDEEWNKFNSESLVLINIGDTIDKKIESEEI